MPYRYKNVLPSMQLLAETDTNKHTQQDMSADCWNGAKFCILVVAGLYFIPSKYQFFSETCFYPSCHIFFSFNIVVFPFLFTPLQLMCDILTFSFLCEGHLDSSTSSGNSATTDWSCRRSEKVTKDTFCFLLIHLQVTP